MTFLAQMDPATGLLNGAISEEALNELRHQYADAQPFRHIVFEDFLPEEIAYKCLAEFECFSDDENAQIGSFDRAQERGKRQFSPETLSPFVRQIFYTFNSQHFVQILESISGIDGLIPDPYFLGGGLHEVANGGHLSVHADFNRHPTLNLERRINLLIYLNEDWRDDFGGQLELWSKDMSSCVQSIVPVFNRAVMFNTTSHSNHGNPKPVNHPKNQSRKSIALYYYTATWDGLQREHTTQFRTRPESADAHDWRVRGKELLVDLLPPLVLRSLRRLRR